MRLYWVLMWDDYYPDSHLENVKGTFESHDEAEKFILLYKEKVQDEDYHEYVHDYNHYEIVNVSDMIL